MAEAGRHVQGVLRQVGSNLFMGQTSVADFWCTAQQGFKHGPLLQVQYNLCSLLPGSMLLTTQFLTPCMYMRVFSCNQINNTNAAHVL